MYRTCSWITTPRASRSLVMFFALLVSPLVAQAQETAPATAPVIAPVAAPVTAPVAAPVTAPVTAPQRDQAQVGTPSSSARSTAQSSPLVVDPSVANTETFASAQDKEARLEELRYKHLWIAYSLVWLIIFFFIRQTWIRHQAVASRLDELQTRLKDLERD